MNSIGLCPSARFLNIYYLSKKKKKVMNSIVACIVHVYLKLPRRKPGKVLLAFCCVFIPKL
jgi:hypothetical protein